LPLVPEEASKNEMTGTAHCPNCQKALPAGSPHGLCQECLLKAGLPTGTASRTADGGKTGFVPPTVEELAAKFPQLEILEFLGRGGMGAVYKARQKDLYRMVALKILPPEIGKDLAFAERFAQEARALARLNHPGIVTVYDFGRADGLYYFLMEFVDGVTLRQLMNRGRVSPREALAIVPQICDSLQYAHDQGIVHRDIKPENILLDRLGRVKVADFGLAKLILGSADAGEREAPAEEPGGGLTESGKILGTPNYMAPEQLEHPEAVDHRADIYALGVVFYQMLTGELPGKRIEPPSKLVQVDVRLDEVVLRALEKDPGRRYSQASVLKTQVETIAGTASPSQQAQDAGAIDEPSGPFVAPRPPAQARLSRTAVMATILLGLDVVALLLWLCLPSLYSVIFGSAPFLLLVFIFVLPTAFGWLAIFQIRRSAGRLRGMQLAVFDALIIPVGALGGLVPEINGVPGLLSLGVVLLIVIWIYGSVWSWASSPPAPGALPPETGKSPHPEKAKQTKHTKSVLYLLFTIGWQLLLLFLAFYFFLYLVPRFRSEFESLGGPLPASIWIIFSLSSVLKAAGILLIPLLLSIAIGVCILLWYYDHRRLLRFWSIGMVAGLGLAMAFSVLSLARHSGTRGPFLEVASSSGQFYARLPTPGPRQEQHSYVQQKLSSDLGVRLHEAGVDLASWLVTLPEDLSQAEVSMQGITKKRSRGRIEAVTNAGVQIRYLGEGRFFCYGTGPLQGIHFVSDVSQWMSNGPIPVPPAPPSRRFDDLGLPYPQFKVLLPWDHQIYEFPNPLALAEAMAESRDYQAWNNIPKTNILGYSYTYALLMNVPKRGEPQKASGLAGGLTIRRPDGTTLAAVTDFDNADNTRKAAIRVYDETGEHPLVQLNLERENDTAPLHLVEVRWDPGTGYERIWTVNRFGVVYGERIAQPGGTEVSLHDIEELAEKPLGPQDWKWHTGIWVDPSPPESNEFEQVVEVTLRDSLDMSHPELPKDVLDFESGQVRLLPDAFGKPVEQAEVNRLRDRVGLWFYQNGIDLMQDTAPIGVALITSTRNELKLAEVPDEMWRTTRGFYLKHALSATNSSSSLPEYERAHEMNPGVRAFIVETNTPVPVTMAFQTGEGTMGVVQLIRFGKRDQSLSLRYKLLKPDLEAIAAGMAALNEAPDYIGAAEVLGLVNRSAEQLGPALADRNHQLAGELISGLRHNVQLYASLLAGAQSDLLQVAPQALDALESSLKTDDFSQAGALAQRFGQTCKEVRLKLDPLRQEHARAWKQLVEQSWRAERLRPEIPDDSEIVKALSSLSAAAGPLQRALSTGDLSSARAWAPKVVEQLDRYEKHARPVPGEMVRLRKVFGRLLEALDAGNLVLAKSLNEICEVHAHPLTVRLARLQALAAKRAGPPTFSVSASDILPGSLVRLSEGSNTFSVRYEYNDAGWAKAEAFNAEHQNQAVRIRIGQYQTGPSELLLRQSRSMGFGELSSADADKIIKALTSEK
jgi:tRNA A-37 threonylcarbamoyl transferase component Bud32/uncharacterized membrane protein